MIAAQNKGLNLGYEITDIQTTPNPRARKLIVSPMPGRIVSVINRDAGADDPLAAAILGCDGVRSVLVHMEFVSVVFDEQTKWAALKKQIGETIGVIDE